MVSILDAVRPVRPPHRTRALPPVFVHHAWLPRRWIVGWLIVFAVTAAAGTFAWLWRAGIDEARQQRLEQAEAAQVIESRIKIIYDADGIVCQVPPAREDVAPAVHGACQALANQLQRLAKGGK